MAGVPGKGGGIPKRSDQRRRRNKQPVKVDAAPTPDTVIPPADPRWHPIAAGWYESLATSGQSRWYANSDWQLALYVANLMHDSLMHDGKPVAGLYAKALDGMSLLMTSEADRRRLRIELAKAGVDNDDDAAVAAIDDYRSRLSS